jgi:hypothetical protein
MFDFLNHADIYLQTFWYIAIPVSLIFLIQAVITFSGLGADADIDSDISLDGSGFFDYFTVRNGINFLLGFSWGGICFYSLISSKILLIAVAILSGFVFFITFFYLIQQIKKLEENNSFNPLDTIGKEGEVYLRIPENGKGKIFVSQNGATQELDAISDGIFIDTGTKITIVDVLENNILVVRPS